MALSADQPLSYSKVGHESSLPVQVSSTIYAGAALSIDTGGEVGPFLVADAAFVGFALNAVAAVGTAGDTDVRVVVEGEVELTVVGINDNNDIGDIVYATADNVFTLSSTGGMSIGRVSQINAVGDTQCLVHFSGSTMRDHILA